MRLCQRPTMGRPPGRRAVVLLFVLVVVVLLTLAAYRYNDLMAAEYRAADSLARGIQARALADSGVHYAAALLSNPAAFAGALNGAPLNSPQAFQGVVVRPHAQPRFRGRFSVVAPPDPDEPPGDRRFRYGVTDEAGKLNLNALMALDPRGKALHDRLMALPYMTEEIADAIVDWMDPDDQPRPHGAEDEYYQTLNPPYHCKNGPLDSLEELLLVRGVTPELLFGNDQNRNGVLDAGEDGGGAFDRGWSAYLTVYSREQNIDAQNNPRIYVNSLNVQLMHDRLVDAVGPDLAYYIAAYRLYGPAADPIQQQARAALSTGIGVQAPATKADSSGSKQSNSTGTPKQPDKTPSTPKRPDKTPSKTDPSSSTGETKKPPPKSATSSTSAEDSTPKEARPGERDPLDFDRKPARTISSLYELIGTKVIIPDKQGGKPTLYECPLNDPGTLRELLSALLDRATTSRDSDIPARVNVNTAPLVVLAALPGLTESDVQSILEHRPDPWSGTPPDPVFRTPAWLITEGGLTPQTMKKLEKYLTARSQTYRVQVLGYFDRGGPTARVEAVIDTNAGRPRIVHWRDLTELGQGFNLEK